MVKIKSADPKTGEVRVMDAECTPFVVLEEHFNLYQLNVPEGHPLAGKTVKAKFVVSGIVYLGLDELGNPNVSLQGQTIVGME